MYAVYHTPNELAMLQPVSSPSSKSLNSSWRYACKHLLKPISTWRHRMAKSSLVCCKEVSLTVIVLIPWTSYQIRKIASSAYARNAVNVSSRLRLQRKPLVSDPGMHHGTCVTHVPWCMSGSLTRGGGENDPGIPGICAARKFTYLTRGPLRCMRCRATNTGAEAYWNWLDS